MDYAAAILSRLPTTRRGTGFKRLLGKLDYLGQDQLDVVVRAYETAARAHEGQRRYSGEAYISHPVAVAGILADLRMDYETIAAALMHDLIEDTPTAKEQIQQDFGAEIAVLVDGVSKLDQLNFDSRAEAQTESFRKMMLAMVQDIRVMLLKLADRLHNMQTLEALPPAKQGRIARETLEIYAPIANRLGVYQLKTELEELGFRYAYPFRHRVLERAVRRAQGNQRQIVRRTSARLEAALKEAGIDGKVRGRQKNLYSIYRKMATKQRSLSEIADVFGFRLIVDSPDNCYRALGLAHALYKPMPGRFKDYIAIPRVNGYQSLHTTLFGPNGIPLEVQIRTAEMDRIAERGVAAHWQYKATDKRAVPPQTRAREWLTSITEMESAANSEEFMEQVKVDLFPDKVYVLSPPRSSAASSRCARSSRAARPSRSSRPPAPIPTRGG
jgi:GTP pyrophosphokinase